MSNLAEKPLSVQDLFNSKTANQLEVTLIEAGKAGIEVGNAWEAYLFLLEIIRNASRHTIQ